MFITLLGKEYNSSSLLEGRNTTIEWQIRRGMVVSPPWCLRWSRSCLLPHQPSWPVWPSAPPMSRGTEGRGRAGGYWRGGDFLWHLYLFLLTWLIDQPPKWQAEWLELCHTAPPSHHFLPLGLPWMREYKSFMKYSKIPTWEQGHHNNTQLPRSRRIGKDNSPGG